MHFVTSHLLSTDNLLIAQTLHVLMFSLRSFPEKSEIASTLWRCIWKCTLIRVHLTLIMVWSSHPKWDPLSNQLGIILLKNMEINVVLPELQSKQNMSCYV